MIEASLIMYIVYYCVTFLVGISKINVYQVINRLMQKVFIKKKMIKAPDSVKQKRFLLK